MTKTASLSTTLEGFQKKTSDYVFKILRRHPIYSVADQVGLGKTWIVADVMARRLNQRPRVGKHTFLFYVAPSEALLRQNIKRIYRYMSARSQTAKPSRRVACYLSRLSTLLSDSAAQLKKLGMSRGGCLHIVGLTSDVSFKLSGTGTLSERAFLCAVYLGEARSARYRAKIGNEKVQLSRWFFLLKGRSSQSFHDWYETVRAHVRTSRNLIRKVRRHLDIQAIEQEFLNRTSASNRESAFVRIVRRHVTEAALRDMKVADIILDEWHRYSELCIEESIALRRRKSSNIAMILPKLLHEIRTKERKHSAVLLVSATPFVVRFEGQAGQQDLQALARIEFGKDAGDALFQEILKHQNDFLHAVHRASEEELGGRSEWTPAVRARRLLQETLLKLTVRTERPVALERGADSADLGRFADHWRQVDLLVHVAAPNVNSPVPALWSDSRRFVVAGDYKPVQRHWEKLPRRRGSRLLKTAHWKIGELQRSVHEMFASEPRAKDSYRASQAYYPPLWLKPRSDSLAHGVSKILIFSEFTISPAEISDAISFGPRFGKEGRSSEEFSSSIYGWFPDYRGYGRTRPDKILSWANFFPLVSVERTSADYLPKLQDRFARLFAAVPASTSKSPSKKRDVIWVLLALDHYLLKTSVHLGAQWLADGVERIKVRAQLFHVDFAEIQRMTRSQLLNVLHNHPHTGMKDLVHPETPAVIFAQAVAKLRARFGDKGSAAKELEQSILDGAKAVLRLFSTPEAQLICKRVYRLSKEKVQFARRYCKDHNLGGTLDEYFDLLATEYLDSDDPLGEIMKEFHTVVTLGRGKTNQSRYIRPYSDSAPDKHAGSQSKIGAADIRVAFNSPFAPYILVTTSVGQEGIDFHRYCRRIIHWSAPHCPSVLQQREGRLDRYRSLQVREAIESAKQLGIAVKQSGFSPHFAVLTEKNERLNSLQRKVLFLPFSQQEKRWERCLERSYLTGILVGTPDPVSVELRFRSLKERCENQSIWQKILGMIRQNSVSLEPPDMERKGTGY